MPARQREQGAWVARALAGAWRAEPPPLDLAAEQLDSIAPLLLRTGAGALGWWRVRNSGLRAQPAAVELQEVYRFQTLRAAVYEGGLVAAVAALRSVGVEPLIGKGPAIARAYPERGLRPSGDLDLYVRRSDHAAAARAIESARDVEYELDLHRGFGEVDDRADQLHRRCRRVALRGGEVSLLGCEDHLRLIALHLLKHGAWRPLWLCDLAAAVETAPADFDWDLCLRGDPRHAAWIGCALRLAEELLAARLDGAPPVVRRQRLPKWLMPSVLRDWGELHHHREPLLGYLRHPKGVWTALKNRWPGPLEATLLLDGAPSDLPRFPVQLGALVRRAAEFGWRGVMTRR